jgi:hypothetical protein
MQPGERYSERNESAEDLCLSVQTHSCGRQGD